MSDKATPAEISYWAWLVVTDENRIFEITSDQRDARRAAKAIKGYIVRLNINEDYRSPAAATVFPSAAAADQPPQEG